MHLPILTTLTTLLATALTAPLTSEFLPPAPFDTLTLAAAGKTTTTNALDLSLTKRNIGGVRMSDARDFGGRVWYGIYPLNTCIDLRSYAGNLLSFRPDEGTECLVMQARCNGNDEFADMYHNSSDIGDLSGYFWIGQVTSYICLEE